jgi:vancomycin resistance protein YoaR
MTQTRNIPRAADRPRTTERSTGQFNRRFLIAVAVAVPIVILLAATLIYRSAYAGRIYLGVGAGNIALDGYTPDEARTVLVARFQQYAATPLTLRFQGQEWRATPGEMGMRFDVEETVKSAYAIGRDGSYFSQIGAQLDAWRKGEAATRPLFRLDAAQRSAFFTQLARQIDRQPVDAKLTLLGSEFRARVSPSRPGRALNVEKTSRRIEEAIAVQASAPIDLVVDEQPPAVFEADLQATKELAEKMMSAPLEARFEGRSWRIERDDIAEWLAIREQLDASPKAVVDVADQPLQRLVARMAKEINRRPSNARFDYGGGNLKVIRESVDGRTLDVAATIAGIKAQLKEDARTIDLPVKVVKPAIGSADANKLAIAGVVDQASTVYGYPGALPERVHNVELAASRLHGVVVAPGELFSFNEEVGPVNTLSGYKVGFGITQEDGNAVTVPSVGGGICQVATTLFQPVFWAGYEIGDRVPHLYWIPRYGTPPKGLKGLDTTVDQIYDKEGNLAYAVDFTFNNNSPHPVLIQSKADGKDVTFTLLGTKPTWQVKVDGPVIENVVKPITGTVRQEDPTFPAGRSIMIEEAREGFKATIVRVVEQDGKLVDRHRFVSEYVPTRNVILVGTKKEPAPPAAAPSPTPAGR